MGILERMKPMYLSLVEKNMSFVYWDQVPLKREAKKAWLGLV